MVQTQKMRSNDKGKNTDLPYWKLQAEHEPPIPFFYKNANTILCGYGEFRLTYKFICSSLIQYY